MKLIILFIAIIILNNNQLNAQASLYADNIMEGIEVKDPLTNEITSYTLRRDHSAKNQWYYEPKRLRLAEKIVPGHKPEPKISIIKYKYTDKLTNTLKEGGMIFASFTFSARPGEEEQLRKKLQAKYPNARLSCMQYKTSKYTILPLAQEFTIDSSSFKVQKGSISNSDMTVALPLSALGVSVLAESGFTVRNELVYTGMLPPCDLVINGKWDNVYDYAENRKHVGGGFKFLGIGIGASKKTAEIKEELKQNCNFQITDMGCDDQVSDARFAQVINTIRDEVFVGSKALSDIERIAALQKLASDTSISKAVSDKILKAITVNEVSFTKNTTKIKSTQRKTGNINFNYKKYTLADRETNVSGLLNLKEYNFTNEELKKYILEVNFADGFPEVVFGLPPDFDQSLKIKSATLRVKIPQQLKSLDPNLNNVQDKTVTWTAQNGWQMLGKPVASLPFALLGVKKEIIDKLYFQSELSVSSEFSNNTFTIKNNITAFNGVDNFDAIEQLVNIVRVDATAIDFAKLTQNQSDIDFVKVKFKQGSKTYSKDIKPLLLNNTPQIPDVVTFMIPKDANNQNSIVTAEILFYRGDKPEPKVWDGVFDGSEITLRNLDWKN